jgi:hypothetical protein
MTVAGDADHVVQTAIGLQVIVKVAIGNDRTQSESEEVSPGMKPMPGFLLVNDAVR